MLIRLQKAAIHNDLLVCLILTTTASEGTFLFAHQNEKFLLGRLSILNVETVQVSSEACI